MTATRAFSSLLLLACSVFFGLAQAATPATGTLTDAAPLLTYDSGPFAVSNSAGMCLPPLLACDEYTLTINLPADYALTHPKDRISISTLWSNTSEDFDIFLLDADGNEVTNSASLADPEVMQIPAASGSVTYTVRIVPYSVQGGSTVTTIKLFTPAEPPPVVPPKPPTGQPPRFTNYSPALGIANSGEPSVGYNVNTKRGLYIASTSQYRVVFPQDQTPALPEACDADWQDVTFPYTGVITLDPILFTDFKTGRTFVSQLLTATNAVVGGPLLIFQGLNSIYAYTDDDGDNWSPGQIGLPQTSIPPRFVPSAPFLISGADHQTTGSGPYAPGTKPATASYDRAVYYCSQGFITAYCSRSDDGGSTFLNPAVEVYTSQDDGCGGLHGHIRVSETDGTAYLPNKDCHGHAAVAVSGDSGDSWSISEVPDSSSGESDPSIGLATDGTGYLCYVGLDNHPRVAVTKDRGQSWGASYDIGALAGVQTAVFPQAIAGDPDRASCAFIGTSEPGNYQAGDFAGIWYAYVATTYDGGQTWHTVNVSPNQPVQREGGVCQGGSSCAGNNRNLLDFNEISIDERGGAVFGWADGCVGGCEQAGPNSFAAHGNITRQIGGRTLYKQFDGPTVAPAKGACLAGTREAAASHLTWRVPDNGGADITSYRIYRGTPVGNETLLAEQPGAKASYDDPTADPSVSNYTYTIKAINAQGEGVFSNIVNLPIVALPIAPSPCLVPGILVAEDASGDNMDAPLPGHDVRSVYVAEPLSTDGVDKFVFSLGIDSTQVLPPNTIYYITFTLPDGLTHFVSYDTSVVPAAFSYGHVDPPTGGVGGGTNVDDGTADPESAVDGTNDRIVWVLTKSKIAALSGATALGSVTGEVRQLAGAAGTGLILTIDGSTPGTYSIFGNNFCLPNIAPLASLTATPISGTSPLTVAFVGSGSDSDAGDSIASYRFDFGDSSQVVTQANGSISHVYQRGGTYPVKLVVTDSRGLVSSNIATATITVTDKAGGGSPTVPVIGAPGAATPVSTTSSGRFGGGAMGWALLLPMLLARRRFKRR